MVQTRWQDVARYFYGSSDATAAWRFKLVQATTYPLLAPYESTPIVNIRGRLIAAQNAAFLWCCTIFGLQPLVRRLQMPRHLFLLIRQMACVARFIGLC